MRGVLRVVFGGCSGARSTKVTPEVLVDDFLMLTEEGRSWTYRDDGEAMLSPENATLLRARHAGDGVLDFRRGTRWADGESEAMVAFSRPTACAWWSGFGRIEGQGEYPLATSTTEEGSKVANGSWTCTTERPDLVETYYGDFSDVLTFHATVGRTGWRMALCLQCGLGRL